MRTTLHVSLGHNSSAAVASPHGVISAFEQERLDRVKSSSAFPMHAIELALINAEVQPDCAFVSHWFDRFDLPDCKYFNRRFMLSRMPVTGLMEGYTHHDAHARSAARFYKGYRPRFDERRAFVLVADGFGNLGECLSFYAMTPSDSCDDGFTLERKHRAYGYELSLGMMYQYATSFLGMKENQDEYKLLGYESQMLLFCLRPVAETIYAEIAVEARDHARRMLGTTRANPVLDGRDDDVLFDKAGLALAKDGWRQRFERWLGMMPIGCSVRAFIAFCAQTFIEEAVLEVLRSFDVKDCDLLLAGGIFYNVKLNRRILTGLERVSVCVHPLSGDQGASLGMGPAHTHRDLLWGHRMIDVDGRMPAGVELVREDDWPERARAAIARAGYVNVVRGSMEYGPRALGNTTTYAVPTRESVKLINQLNARSDVMPMAPVVTEKAAHELFQQNELERTIGSNRYMVITHSFKQRPEHDVEGVSHPDPFKEFWTARPQVVADYTSIARLLRMFPRECLINTSYNYHGEPIVYSARDAIATHQLQSDRAKLLGVTAPTTLLVQP